MDDHRNTCDALKQWENVEKHLPPGTDTSRLTQAEARMLLYKYNPPSKHWTQDPATGRQMVFLYQCGKWRPGMRKGEASRTISEILKYNELIPGYLEQLRKKASLSQPPKP